MSRYYDEKRSYDFLSTRGAGKTDEPLPPPAGGLELAASFSARATLDFPSTAAQQSSDLTVSVPGAALNDIVSIGVPNGSVNANSCFTAWVSAVNVVSIRLNNYSASAIDPASGVFTVAVFRFR